MRVIGVVDVWGVWGGCGGSSGNGSDSDIDYLDLIVVWNMGGGGDCVGFSGGERV